MSNSLNIKLINNFIFVSVIIYTDLKIGPVEHYKSVQYIPLYDTILGRCARNSANTGLVFIIYRSATHMFALMRNKF